MAGRRLMRWLARGVARFYLGRPDQAELIAIKYPELSDLPAALLNELCYRLRLSRSWRLTALNVELTSRCNLSCAHCPRSGPVRRPDADMDLATFQRIVDRTPGLKVLLPFQWGEPLLSPILVPAVAYAAERGIRVFVTTNGTRLDDTRSRGLLEAGLERLTVSFDGSAASHEALRGVRADRVLDNIRRFRRLRDALGRSCALDVSMVVDGTTEGLASDFREAFSNVADRLQFVPRFVPGRRRRACRELWRGVLVVLAGGEVTICCADHAGRALLGHVDERSPSEWFNSPAMRDLRRRHRRGDWPALCARCAEYATPLASPRFSGP